LQEKKQLFISQSSGFTKLKWLGTFGNSKFPRIRIVMVGGMREGMNVGQYSVAEESVEAMVLLPSSQFLCNQTPAHLNSTTS
jgi:uridine phosphorylase